MSQKCSSQVFIFESVKSIKGRPVAIAGGMCYVFIWQMVLSGEMGRSNKKGWKFSLKVRQGVKNPLEDIMIYLCWSYIIIMGGKCTPRFEIRIHNRKVTNVLKDECKDWKPPHVFTQSASSYSPKVKVSIPILNVYWPGKICQFWTSICQMISPMTSVRTPRSLEMGESGS